MNFIDVLTINDKHRREDGALIVDARAARTGIQIYSGSEVGKPDMAQVRVYRPGAEVFHVDSLRSYAHRPVTNDHPPESVTADNWRKYAVGQTADEIIGESIYVRVPLMVSDAKSIADIEAGKRDLSCGYACDLEFTAGLTADGQSYDAVQKNIRINHIAIVDNGRAGDRVRIGDQWGASPNPTIDHRKEDTTMAKIITLDGMPIDISDTSTAETVINRLVASFNDAKAANTKLVADHTTALAAKDTKIGELTAQLDAANKKIPDGAAVDKMVADRVTIIATGRAIVADLKYDGLTNADIRKAVVKAKLGDDTVKDANDDAIAGMFAVLAKGVKPATTDANANDAFRQVFSGMTPQDRGNVNDRDKAQDGYEDRLANQWKTPFVAPTAAQ